MVQKKREEVIDGMTIKYHANGQTIWSKGKMLDNMPEGYWEWYRIDGSIKRSGYFAKGEQVGKWTTYNMEGSPVKVTTMKQK